MEQLDEREADEQGNQEHRKKVSDQRIVQVQEKRVEEDDDPKSTAGSRR